MKLINKQVTNTELKDMSRKMFGNLVKAVIDIEKEVMVVDAELHSDQEALLLELGSQQKNLWGINLYPELEGDDFVEFDSMINLRPGLNNMSRGVDDVSTQKKILDIVAKLVVK